MSDGTTRPIGSGIFAIVMGATFLAVLALRPDFTKIDPQISMNCWFGFVGVSMVGWGIRRVWKSKSRSFTVGQDTLNWAVGILAATFGLLALFHH